MACVVGLLNLIGKYIFPNILLEKWPMCFRRWRAKWKSSWMSYLQRKICIWWWTTSPPRSQVLSIWETLSRRGWPSCQTRMRWTMMKNKLMKVVMHTWSILSITLIMKWDLPAHHLCFWRSGKYILRWCWRWDWYLKVAEGVDAAFELTPQADLVDAFIDTVVGVSNLAASVWVHH